VACTVLAIAAHTLLSVAGLLRSPQLWQGEGGFNWEVFRTMAPVLFAPLLYVVVINGTLVFATTQAMLERSRVRRFEHTAAALAVFTVLYVLLCVASAFVWGGLVLSLYRAVGVWVLWLNMPFANVLVPIGASWLALLVSLRLFRTVAIEAQPMAAYRRRASLLFAAAFLSCQLLPLPYLLKRTDWALELGSDLLLLIVFGAVAVATAIAWLGAWFGLRQPLQAVRPWRLVAGALGAYGVTGLLGALLNLLLFQLGELLGTDYAGIGLLMILWAAAGLLVLAALGPVCRWFAHRTAGTPAPA
jgi:hypothetical protein